jgi:hypothetical protein
LDISLVTIGKRLRESKLFCRVARQKEHLSVGPKARRLQFAQIFRNFDIRDKTIFVDENTFMTGHAVRTLVQRPVGTAFEERFIVEKAKSGRCSVPVFGILCSRGIGPLVRIEGRFDAEKIYRNIRGDSFAFC